MDRRLFTFSVVLAVSITLKPIPITAQQKGAQQKEGVKQQLSQRTPQSQWTKRATTDSQENSSQQFAIIQNQQTTPADQKPAKNDARNQEIEFPEKVVMWSSGIQAAMAVVVAGFTLALVRPRPTNHLRIFVYGVLLYDDGFGNERKTGFCFKWKSSEGYYRDTGIPHIPKHWVETGALFGMTPIENYNYIE